MTLRPPSLILGLLAAIAFAAAPRAQVVSLPIDFENTAISYELTDFGGNMSSLVADPTDATNRVVQSVRTAASACFAGTTVADTTGFASRVPFAPGATTMSVRVWSPVAGIPVLFKVEEVGNAGLFVETLATTTMAGAWETLVFDFGNPMPNMNPIQFGANYNKASIFFDFSCNLPPGPAPPERTYYWDDVTFGGTLPPMRVSLPIDFENTAINYELTDFGGNMSSLVADPTDATNRVVQSVRTAASACFAGTTVAELTGFTARIPFAVGSTAMSIRVWSPAAGIPVLVKVEEVGNAGLFVETMATTTMAGAWETLVFDFGNPMPNMNPIQFGANYNKASIFFDFSCNLPPGPAPPERTYYWDDVTFGGTLPPMRVSLPIDFENTAINYELTDFGGNMSSLVADPTDATNRVVQSVRTAAAQCFAGTTVADTTGFASRVPFVPGATTMSVRVWSPVAGIPVLFKVEEVGVPQINVETLATTTMAGAWETIVFDFGNPMPNLNPIQFGANYNKASIFFDFSCNLPPGPAPPERTYYWDDVTFGGTPPPSGTTIAEARTLGVGNEVTVSGVVTRAKGAFTYFQDATAGLTIRQTSGAFFDDVASGAIAPGTRITVTGTTSQFNGLFQINAGDFASYTINGTAAIPAAQTITLAGLSETHEGELVSITDLTTAAIGTFTASTSYDVTDPTGAGVLRVVGGNDSDIDGTDIPPGAFTFTGVVGQFDSGAGNTGYQLLAIRLGDIEGEAVPVVSLPITFEETINYELTDFGGNMSSLVADPTDATNTVVQSVRTAAAACFAGTTVAELTGFTSRVPFAPGATTMSVRVWSPVAGIPVLFKVEEVGVPQINVETLMTTTVAGAWENLVFDFGNPMPNLNPIQFGANYNKASIFFDFSCNLPPGPAPPERTYYWDDVTFGLIVATDEGPAGLSAAPSIFPNPTRDAATVTFELATASDVTVEVFDALGRRLTVAFDGPHAAGSARIAIPTSDLPAGLAFVRVRTDAGVATTQLSIVR